MQRSSQNLDGYVKSLWPEIDLSAAKTVRTMLGKYFVASGRKAESEAQVSAVPTSKYDIEVSVWHRKIYIQSYVPMTDQFRDPTIG